FGRSVWDVAGGQGLKVFPVDLPAWLAQGYSSVEVFSSVVLDELDQTPLRQQVDEGDPQFPHAGESVSPDVIDHSSSAWGAVYLR
ncbi:MAG: hypothetical protein J7M39_03805, partial [Anaerolineae bacterium]|nr:hypothetical protein [Anaerolineae bacterium]